MRKRACVFGLVALLVGGLLAPLGRHSSAGEKPAAVGKAIAAFMLPDTRGKAVALADFGEANAIVVVFVGTQCPINNSYLPQLAELDKQFRPRGVQFLAINANEQDSPAEVAEHARKHEIPFPVLKDAGNRVADAFGATRTPEAFVLDARRIVRYQGRIDDQYGNGYKRAQPTRRDLVTALEEVLAGKPVSHPTTTVAGCIIGRAAPRAEQGSVTFSRQVARILQGHCQDCHRPDHIGPMPLLTYDDAAAWSATIREVIQDGRMPPWHADAPHGKFSNDRSLSKAERDTLLTWIDQGCPRGDEKDLPPPRQFVPGWSIGTPDTTFTMKEKDAFHVPAESPKGGIPYQYFEVETHFTEDKWVERAEAKAGATAVVHHIVIFIVPPGLTFIPEQGNAPLLCGTAPGDMPLILPAGMAKKIPARSKLIFQMHYTANGKAATDRSTVGIVFAKEPPKKQVFSLAIANLGVDIPPGADDYQIEQTFKFGREGQILGFMPHMHLRGKDFKYEALYPDGRRETLLSVPRYNFNWQSVYRCAQPIPMPKGSTLHCVAHFDNSAKNPNNPDPTVEVRWGDQTWEEMMIGWTDVAFDLPRPSK